MHISSPNRDFLSTDFYKSCSHSFQSAKLFCQKAAYRAICFFSAKQEVRPDSMKEAFSGAFLKTKSWIISRTFRIFSIFKIHHPCQEYLSYLTAILTIQKLIKNPETVLTPEEKHCLNELPQFFMQNPNILDHFDSYIQAEKNETLPSLHFSIKQLFEVSNDRFFENFCSKIQKCSQLNEAEALDSDDKLNIHDISLLIAAPIRKALCETLLNQELNDFETICARWTCIETFSKLPFIEDLKKACDESKPSGSIFLVNRQITETMYGIPVQCTKIAQQLFMGRLCHIGIHVRQSHLLKLSHVNLITNSHSITASPHALMLPFFYCLELSIEPLLPYSLSDQERSYFNQRFLKCFQELAEQAHTEHSLAGFKEHVKMFLKGHKGDERPLTSVELPAKGTPLMCSSYVGILFLQSIKQINEELALLGHEEIPHPFGENENLMHLDILRLLYLWKKIKVIREIKPLPRVSQLIDLPEKLQSISYTV